MMIDVYFAAWKVLVKQTCWFPETQTWQTPPYPLRSQSHTHIPYTEIPAHAHIPYVHWKLQDSTIERLAEFYDCKFKF